MEQAFESFEIPTKILSALQEIPGETAHEKQKWLVEEIKKKIDDNIDLENLVVNERLPKDLHPLIKIEAAKMSIRLGNKDPKNFEQIKNGLLSENSEFVTRALGLNEYFDGSNEALNSGYFTENLFPFVTYSTRLKIIKRLSKSLPSQPAEELFEKILKIYGLKEAETLLVACSSDFLRESITKYRIVLSPHCVLKLFQKDSDLIFWYLKLSDPKKDTKNRFKHKIDIGKYSSFLPKLIKRHLKEFLAIVELQGEDFYYLKLSKKQTRRFQRNAREEYLSKPKLFFKFLDMKKISEQDLEEMFPKMFPKLENFDVDSMLGNLEYYPKQKTAQLFLDSYEKAYGRNLLDNEKAVTETLMKFLRTEDRLKLAKIKAEKQAAGKISRWETNWKCYLSVEEIVPNLRSELKKASDVNKRISLIEEILLCCEVNNDLEELMDVLKLIRDRHRNETPYFHQAFLRKLQNLHKVLTKEHWDVIFEIIQRLWIKIDQSDFRSLPRDLLEAGLKFKLDNDQSTGLIFEWLFYVISHDYWHQWAVSDEPKIQRVSLENFWRIAEQVGRKGGNGWDEVKERTVTALIEQSYEYNQRCLQRNALSEILPTDGLSWHFDELFRILKEDNVQYSSLKTVLKKYNKELYEKLWPSEKDLIEIDVQTLNRLKRDPKAITSQWEKYFDECLKWSHTKLVHRFIRKLAWCNDLPKKFLEKCLANVKDEETRQKGDSFILISLLIDGDSYSKLAEPFLPTKDIDVVDPEAGEQFSLIRNIVTGMKLVNPPVQLQLIERLCQGDYLSTALSTLENSCKRTKLPTALDFSINLSKQRVSVGKHGVRLMSKLGNFEEIFNFFKNTWLQQDHYSIRSIVLAETQNLFAKFPNEKTWGLTKEMIESMKEKDEPMLDPWPFKVDLIPDEYVVEFMKILVQLVEKFEALIPEKKERNLYGYSLLINIDSANFLPEDFMETLLKKYLFNESPNFINRAEGARSFLVSKYLETEKLEERLNVLTKIFKEQVKNDCLLVKTATRELILRIVFNKWETVDRKVIISHVLEIFSSILSFSDDPKSYLLLNFANEWVNSKDLAEFANRIARKLPVFYEKLTPWFSYQLADSLRDFLNRNYFDLEKNREEIIKEVIVTFLEHKEIEVVCTVAQMLSLIDRNEEEEYIPLFKKLRENEHPAVQSLVNDLLK